MPKTISMGLILLSFSSVAFATADPNQLSECVWDKYFTILAKFNIPIADFFIHVMVMDDNPDVREARLMLLWHLYQFFNQQCVLSELS